MSYSHIAHLSTSTFLPPLDLHPLYPTPSILSQALDSSSTLTPQERATLVNHSLSRGCLFANLSLLTFLLKDERCSRWVELEGRDEDGANAVSVCIMGFRGLGELGSLPDGEGPAEGDVERELEREECIRLLVKEGADLSSIDNSGWTPLHHAALLAPTSLISYLLSHGASPLTLSRRKLTPLDIINAHSPIPGREPAVALLRDATHSLLLAHPEEKIKMHKMGWRGDEWREREREKGERKEERRFRKERIRGEVGGVLIEELGHNSWGWGEDEEGSEDGLFEGSDEEDSDGYDEDTLPTPPDSYRTMLVFSPPALQRIFQCLIPLTPPRHRKLRDPLPAQALYLHCRFASTACDHNWLEDLIVGSMDRVEEVVMANSNDLVSLSHWLFNTTLLLHLLRCDASLEGVCEILGLFGLLEEMVNVIYVLIIRIIERRLDPLIDTALLDHTPPELQEEWDTIQFDGEWEGWSGLIGRVISPKKKPSSSKGTVTPNAQSRIASTPSKPATSTSKISATPGKMMAPPPAPGTISASTSAGSVGSTVRGSSINAKPTHTKNTSLPQNGANKVPSRPSSPPLAQQGLLSASNSSTFNTIKGAIASSSIFSTLEAGSTGPSPSGSVANLIGGKSVGKANGPEQVTNLLTALHTFLSLSGINPVLIVQTFSQVMYWTACEMFNRILQRRKYLCRSRALHIGLNLGVMEEWISGSVGAGLPREVGGHFKVVRELIGWLQCLSSIDQFANLVATVQTFRQLNPLQMRRAVREYRYEVGESKMTEECSQYLAQLQKDWERQRVKMGVKALKKEMGEREGSVSSRGATIDSPQADTSLPSTNSNELVAQQAIDNLFDRTFEKAEWQPAKSPEVLGELLDSRYMLPLLLPSDPMHLGALPALPKERNERRESGLRSLMPPSLSSHNHQGGVGMGTIGGSASRTHSRNGSQIGSRSASRASIGVRGAMEWISRSRRLRVVDGEMLRFLGDDEVASELEGIATKWRFDWDRTIAAGVDGAGVEGGGAVDVGNGGVGVGVVESDRTGMEFGNEDNDPGIKLTLERPRIVKERRRASQMFEDPVH